MGRLNKRQIDFCNYYLEGHLGAKAYRLAYGEEISHAVSKTCACRLLQKEEVKAFIQSKKEEIEHKYGLTKEKQIRDLQKQKERFEEMQKLADKDKLSKDDEKRFRRLTTILKGADYSRICDILNKMGGFYEAEKIDLKQEIILKFGNDNDDDDDDN